jgi:hypothetical protein
MIVLKHLMPLLELLPARTVPLVIAPVVLLLVLALIKALLAPPALKVTILLKLVLSPAAIVHLALRALITTGFATQLPLAQTVKRVNMPLQVA